MTMSSFPPLPFLGPLMASQTGAGSTASMLGMADLGIASRTDMVRNADMISNLDPHHHEVIADMDTGYGGMPAPQFPTPPYLHTHSQGNLQL